MFTTFTASTPLLDVEVDRQKAKALGVPIDQVFGTLQLFMGSQYVNDFNYASRTYRVYLQADAQFRDNPRDIGAFYVRSEPGEMIPLESLVKVTPTTGAQIIRHYNLFRSAEINGQPAPGRLVGRGDRRDGAARRRRAAGGHEHGVDRRQPRAEGERRADARHLRARPVVRVPGAGGAVRELPPAVRRHPVGAARDPRRARAAGEPRAFRTTSSVRSGS